MVGKRLDGRYEIHELLGVGGMAHVYRAYDKVEDRWVAIKVLKEEFLDNSDFLRRFRNESKAIALLQHPNIVKIYDVSLGDKIQYIAMEYVDGITLKDYIDQQGAIRWQEAVHFMIQILSALESAHEKGIIHRDIKPQNIMLVRDGSIKVTDFGIARFLQSETQTMTDKAIGSVHYISPEQARGDYITDKADIYSVGVTMYEMLTGTLPFNSESTVSVALMQLQAKPRMPSEINATIPKGLEQIVLHAMEKNPPDRFRSAAEMLDDIEKFRQNPNIVFQYSYSASGYREPVKDIAEYDTVSVEPQYDDNYEYEEELVKSKRRERGSMALKGVITALVLVLVGFGVMFGVNAWTAYSEREENFLTVPNLEGKIYATEVQGVETYEDFTFQTKEGNDPEKRPGEILKQNPTSGKQIRSGREIVLTINKEGNEKVDLVDVNGLDQSNAITQLRNLGLNPVVENTPHDQVPIGQVIRTDPAAGSQVEKGTAVKVYVSSGPNQADRVDIPSGLVGDSLENVTKKLEALDFQIEIRYDERSEEEENIVVKVDPQAGSTVTKKSTVTVTVSTGKNVSKRLTCYVDLPDVEADLTAKIYRDGALVQSDVINPSYNDSYTVELTGVSGVSEVILQLDGQDYAVMTFHFDWNDAWVEWYNDFSWTGGSGSSSGGSSGGGSAENSGGSSANGGDEGESEGASGDSGEGEAQASDDDGNNE